MIRIAPCACAPCVCAACALLLRLRRLYAPCNAVTPLCVAYNPCVTNHAAVAVAPPVFAPLRLHAPCALRLCNPPLLPPYYATCIYHAPCLRPHDLTNTPPAPCAPLLRCNDVNRRFVYTPCAPVRLENHNVIVCQPVRLVRPCCCNHAPLLMLRRITPLCVLTSYNIVASIHLSIDLRPCDVCLFIHVACACCAPVN
jgi:hypothetical protein